MADDTPAPATDAPEQALDPTEATEPDQELGDAGKKALDTERKARRDAEARLKELEPLAERLREIEDSKKSTEERQAEAMTALERERDEARTEAALLRAAVKHGLSDDDLELLGTGTHDEIEARAERLAKRLAESGQPRKPAPDPTQGAGADPNTSTAAQFAAAISGL